MPTRTRRKGYRGRSAQWRRVVQKAKRKPRTDFWEKYADLQSKRFDKRKKKIAGYISRRIRPYRGPR